MVWFVCIAAVLIFFLLLEYTMYCYAFKRNRRREADDFEIPSDAQYTQFKEKIVESVSIAKSFQYEMVGIISYDGLKLSGRYYNFGQNGQLVIFFHGYRSSAIRDGNGILSICRDKGYDILVVDQRAHGQSEGRTITFGIKERFDCLSWVDFAIRNFGRDTKIVLMGLSMGAATVMMASDKVPQNAKCIIEDCGYSSPRDILGSAIKKMRLPIWLVYPLLKMSAIIFGGFNPDSFSAKRALKNAQVPIIMIHGEADRLVPCYMCRECREACSSEVTMVTFGDAGHGMSYYMDNECYINLVCENLKKAFNL